ncbi:MAG: hypothetical protein LBC28_05085, partial [Oscillospiraceae bacterium]|nr:hypothetical protein [Oscillospiraceae bacterium]
MQYIRGRQISDGGEGYICEVQGRPDLLMKVYKQKDSSGEPVVTPELIGKLAYMKEHPPISLVSQGVIAWPIDLVYENGLFLGFVMPRLDFDEQLQRVYSYKHPDIDADEYGAYPSVSSRVGVAVNLCSALHELHSAGYVVGDLNHENIGINYRNAKVFFVDCDSFHIADEGGRIYRTNVIMPGYLAPEIIAHCNNERADGRAYSLDKVSLPTFTRESDLFCLAIHIFKLLMNGVDPFRGVYNDAKGSVASPFVGNEAIERGAYVFREGNRPAAVFCPTAEAIPVSMSEMFHRAFMDGGKNPRLRPDAQAWYEELMRYYNSLEQCIENPKHQYRKGLSSCPFCEAD